MSPAAACRVERLRLFRFRNYADERIELGPGLNVVSGRNAQGKTSLLEAIATLALTRSPRAAAMGELVTWGASTCRVEAQVVRPDGPVLLDMRVRRGAADVTPAAMPAPGAAAPERAARTTLVDGKERPARALLGICPVVLFWPEDLLLVKGGPEGRRRLCDVLLSQLDPIIAAELVRYRRILEQRNALLRQVRLGSASAAALPGFSAALVRSGALIQVARARLCTALGPLAAAAMAELSDGREQLGLDYIAEGVGSVPADVGAAAARLAAVLDARATEERARGATLAGPHRDDVALLLDGRPARSAASQGQQRSCVLACKLAEVRHLTAVAGMAPVLLLDDVLSELDGGRRARLLELLGAGAASQALLTTAEEAPPPLPGLGEARHLRVEAGRVSAGPAAVGVADASTRAGGSTAA